jgi:hypothetical protein
MPFTGEVSMSSGTPAKPDYGYRALSLDDLPKHRQ